MSDQFRAEADSMGNLAVPADALWGAQTQRAIENFPVSDLRMPRGFIRALGLVKRSAAEVNVDLGGLPADVGAAIAAAAAAIVDGEYDNEFPVDVFQTGSGTSTNMNANEVIASLARARSGLAVHPNDDVNHGQSSNDVIPSCIHVSAVLAVRETLLPALAHLADRTTAKAACLEHVVKTGRTHLMDAMPLRLGQEVGAWAAQLRHGIERLESTLPRCLELAIGGTAVGTGINAHPEFGARVCERLNTLAGAGFRPADNRFAALAAQDSAVELSGQLKVLAVSLMKIANDLRWMNSGPLAGLGEITLPALQPGSSIMPGKVNPVIPESVAMVAAQVIGNDSTITVAGQSGNFQLNVMLPLIAYNLLQSIDLLGNSARLLADSCIDGFTVNEAVITGHLARNPVLVTALNERIGYDLGASIAKRALAEGRAVIDVAAEMTGIDRAELEALLDPAGLT